MAAGVSIPYRYDLNFYYCERVNLIEPNVSIPYRYDLNLLDHFLVDDTPRGFQFLIGTI